MTEAKRKLGLERISVLENRNREILALINDYDKPTTGIEDTLLEIVAENDKAIKDLIKATGQRYEFLFGFEGGGWNSEYAYTIEEAKTMALEKYRDSKNCIVDLGSFRVSTQSDYSNLMSMFY